MQQALLSEMVTHRPNNAPLHLLFSWSYLFSRLWQISAAVQHVTGCGSGFMSSTVAIAVLILLRGSGLF